MTQNVKPTHFRSEGDVNTTPARQAWHAAMDDERTQSLLKRDSDVFLHQAMSTPCLDTLEAAEGIYIQDATGKKYMDFHGNNVHQLGYGHPHVIKRVQDQIAKLPFSPRRFTSETAIECAEKLTQICGGELNRVLFASGRDICRWHGTETGAPCHGQLQSGVTVGLFPRSVTRCNFCRRRSLFFVTRMGPLMAGVERIPPAISYRGAFPVSDASDVHYADYLEYVIEKEGGVGAFIAEAVRNTDVQVPSRAYWKRIREIL